MHRIFSAEGRPDVESHMPRVTRPNNSLNLAPFSRWTLRDKAAQRRLALR